MKSSAWLIIVTILRPYDGYTWNTHQFLDSAFMHEEKITLEILGISHDIFSRSQTVFFDSEVPVTVAAEEILQPMVCVGVEDFAEKPVATVLGRVSRGGDDASEERVTGRPTSIPQWAFREVFRLRDLGYGCRRIVRSLEEAGVFTTKSSVSRLLNQQPPYANVLNYGLGLTLVAEIALRVYLTRESLHGLVSVVDRSDPD